MKIIAFYSSQFHEVKEDNKWCGESGYLELNEKYRYEMLEAV